MLILFPMALLHMPFLGFGTAERDKALETLQIFVLVWNDSRTLWKPHKVKVHLFKSAMFYLQGWTVGAGGPLIVMGLYGSAGFSGGASEGVSGSPLPNTISSIFKISESILVQRYCVFLGCSRLIWSKCKDCNTEKACKMLGVRWLWEPFQSLPLTCSANGNTVECTESITSKRQ